MDADMNRTKMIIGYLSPLLRLESSQLENFILKSVHLLLSTHTYIYLSLISLLSPPFSSFWSFSFSSPLSPLSSPSPLSPTLSPLFPSHLLSLPPFFPSLCSLSLSSSLSPLRSECAYYFSLSWLITWFGHVARSTDEAFRLTDLFLASHPLMPLYLSGAVSHVLYRVYTCIIIKRA